MSTSETCLAYSEGNHWRKAKKKEGENGGKSRCLGLNLVAKKREGSQSLLLSHKTCILNYVECFLFNETD